MRRPSDGGCAALDPAAAIVVLWLVVGGPLGSLQSKVSEVQKNDNSSFLPASAESTEVLDLNKKFASGRDHARRSSSTPAPAG